MGTNDRVNYKSSLSVDLGARYTGVFLVNHESGNIPTSGDCKAATIVMPQEGDSFVYSMRGRTAVRHRLRGKKRFNMARRLLLLIVSEQLRKTNANVDDATKNKMIEALFGLLKRRGYSRLESEIDLTSLENLDVSVFSECPELDGYFSSLSSTSLVEQYERITQSVQNIEGLLSSCEKCDFGEYLKGLVGTEFIEKSQEKLYKKAFSNIKADASNLLMQEKMGHKHRSVYLDDIKEDMARDSRLKVLIDAFGGLDRFWCLVGNISNLQLRANRWYFNLPFMKEKDFFDASRLKSVLVRAFKYFHPEKEDRKKWGELVNKVQSSEDVIDTLCTINPNLTIPPYEDQNNRRPPVDQTLLLSPKKLNQRFGENWRVWSDRFLMNEPSLADGLEEILKHTDRRSRIVAMGGSSLPIDDYKRSYILQRVLDRTSEQDPFRLRLLAAKSQSQKAIVGRDELVKILKSQHVDSFVVFANDYYKEVMDAKDGLWFDDELRLLERSDIHPPMKNKVLGMLVGNVFGCDGDFGEKFIQDIWNQKVKGRSTVRSLCTNIETTRKAVGGEFNQIYNRLTVNKEAKVDATDKPILSVKNAVDAIVLFFKEGLQWPEKVVDRVSNPYSLAQLYTLIETERSGFTSTCVAVHLENAWRMQSDDGQTGARCSRLPADSVRPFDGVLRRVLDRQAYELAKLSANQLKQSVTKRNSDIDFSVLVEENKFSFTASLADIKKNNTAKKKAEQSDSRQLATWKKKEERLKSASREWCAYTDRKLDVEKCEIDHIIPRSHTTELMGTVFNSEANLIYVSQVGNQIKKDRRYYLKDLKEKYLNAIFGTSNRSEITQKIETGVAQLVQNKRIRFFDLLNDQEQAFVRHALFLDDGSEARQNVIRELGSSNRTRVNGTQAWMIRAFIEKMRDLTQDWQKQYNNHISFRAWRTDAFEASKLRQKLGELDNAFEKPQPQPVASHSIDAMCAYGVGCGTPRINNFLGGEPSFGDIEALDNPKETIADEDGVISNLLNLYPRNCEIIRVVSQGVATKKNPDSKPLFKEGILAEVFLPIHQLKEKLYLGYTIPNAKGEGGNCVQITGKKPARLFELLNGYLDRAYVSESDKHEVYRVDREKAFDLLSKSYHAEISEDERSAVNLLLGMRYVTQRKVVSSQFLNTNGNKFVTKEEAKNLDTKIKVDVSFGRDFKCKGSIDLPAKKDWEKIIESDELSMIWGNSVNDLQEDIDGIIARMFKSNSSKNKHSPAHRFPSLPLLATESGGFRIARQGLTNQKVHQLYVVSDAKYSGFSVKDNKVQWKEPVMLDVLKKKNLTATAESYLDSSSSDVALMSDWRKVHDDGEMCISMSPSSKDRRRIRVELPIAEFMAWLKGAKETDVKTDMELMLPYEFKAKEIIPQEVAAKKLLGKPRDWKIRLEHIGTKIVFSYDVESSNAEMNESFNFPIKD